MQWTSGDERWRAWLVDYSAARAKAVERLGDRYLLARPINRSTVMDSQRSQPWKPGEPQEISPTRITTLPT
jgi:hypothetical protein